MSGRLTLEIGGPIATITIDNPAKRDAMSAEMWRALPPMLAGWNIGWPRSAPAAKRSKVHPRSWPADSLNSRGRQAASGTPCRD